MTEHLSHRTQYSHPRDQLMDGLDRIRLLLERYIVRRPWPRRNENPLEMLSDDLRWANPNGIAARLTAQRAAERRRAEAALFNEIELPVSQVQAAFSLSDLEVEFLLAAVAWQVDDGLSRAYSFAWNDYLRIVPTIGFLLDLVADGPESLASLRRSLFNGPLLRARLVHIVQPPRGADRADTLIHRHVRTDERMLGWLLGEEVRDDGVGGLEIVIDREPSAPSLILDEPVRKSLENYPKYLRKSRKEPAPLLLVGPTGAGKRTMACSLAIQLGLPFLAARVEVETWDEQERQLKQDTRDRTLLEHLRIIARDARLLGALGYVELADPDTIFGRRHAAVVAEAGTPLVIGVSDLPPGLLDALGMPMVIDLRATTPETRQALWANALGDNIEDESVIPLLAATAGVTPAMIHRSVRLATEQQKFRPDGQKNTGLTYEVLERTTRLQVEHSLEQLADRVRVPGKWEDLIVQESTADSLDEVIAFARQRRQVLDVWGLRSRIGYGTGLSVLFSGDPGTGKTFAAGLLAKRLGAELYRIDLSQVVDKYIGETEKRLGRIFDEAERAEAILLFDEADSLFGGRTAVGSATDRYANLEVNYLLQRMEDYEGVTILTTNFEAAIDEAFMRRLRFKVNFPTPKMDERLRLWQSMLPPHGPVSDDIDFTELAEDFELTGGLIKNAVLRACIIAAENGTEINHETLMEGAQREHSEQGYLVREGDSPSQRRRERDDDM